ncbi:N-acetylglucosaminyl-phosphatidylinositol de-N-acetylase-like [Littorina saxatilis]|uniref:N-acetylglucosaminyl-phosphatidylinositol de-N-acetylase-like n=1 Tax=Littorina saxatilis TaxID=31220 RepID=UPI0038B5E67D
MASPREFLDPFPYWSLIEWAKLLIVAHVVVCVVSYTTAVLLGGRFKEHCLQKDAERRVLLITAHPDDECMFFSPLLLHLTAERQVHVHVLCLTNGNYYGQGKRREKEILKSCQILGIPESNIAVINKRYGNKQKSVLFQVKRPDKSVKVDLDLPDDPHQAWSSVSLDAEVRAAVDRVQPHQIFTFDDYGVSGHGNHIAVAQAVRKMYKEENRFKGVEAVYHLETVGVWRKYLGVLELPFTLLLSSNVYMLSPQHILRAQRAMLAHGSQLEWFRFLYIILSRYMAINSFTVELCTADPAIRL